MSWCGSMRQTKIILLDWKRHTLKLLFAITFSRVSKVNQYGLDTHYVSHCQSNVFEKAKKYVV